MAIEFELRATRQQDSKVAKKVNTVKKSIATVTGGNDILSRINTIKAMTEKALGQYREQSIVITDESEFEEYISTAVNNGVIAIDTETSGLDPMLDKVVGLCIYTPSKLPAYVPINHISYVTGMVVEGQIKIPFIKTQLDRLNEHNTKIIMFNAKFDIRVIRNGIGSYLTCYWDCYIAERLMNENEPKKGLKPIHNKYVLKGVGDAFKFDDLFKGITFDKIPIQTAYLYASHDAIITYELYEFQKRYLYYEPECEPSARNGMNGVAWVFFNVEMPCVNVVCDMEDNGIEFDMKYCAELSEKYNAILADKIAEFNTALSEYETLIDNYRNNGYKLDNPINIASSSQIAILFYDILKIDPPDPKNPRGTGVDILSRIDNPIAKIILGYREVAKLLSTYIDKLPQCVNPNDGRIHCSFNQYGADTGRFSSSDPNLQNIPSHNKDIRKMFKAKDGYVLMSSDFSQQEPKCLAALCRAQGDSQMYDTFMAGKDLYSEIASKAFNVPYEDCKEFRPDGTTNKEGKARRTQAKSILLGVLYGRGTASVAEQLGCTTDEAQAIKDSVFQGFPAIKEFEKGSLDMASDFGYVTTVCGRKRRLPDLQLNEYEFDWKDGYGIANSDLLDFESDEVGFAVPESKVNYYWTRLDRCHSKAKKEIIKAQALKEGIVITDNGGKIADATRQCVNARIQGSAADLTKIAMIELSRSERLRELGFKILIPVHDEIIAECPEENAKECADLLAETMSKAAERILQMPIKCDVEITRQWYGEPISGEELKQRESYTSHSIDVDNIRKAVNGN